MSRKLTIVVPDDEHDAFTLMCATYKVTQKEMLRRLMQAHIDQMSTKTEPPSNTQGSNVSQFPQSAA